MPDLDAELDAFATQDAVNEQPGTRCWLCTLPERALVERGRERGMTYTSLLRLLRSKYPEDRFSVAKVSNHFTNRHHEAR
jgi:hypothetical protein